VVLSAFYPPKAKKAKKSRPAKLSTAKTVSQRRARSPDKSESDSDNSDIDEPREDCPFQAVAILESIDIDLAANTEQPMEVDGEHLTPSELAEKEFAKHVRTLAAEADTVFEDDFNVKCTDAEHASCIMDIVSLYSLFPHFPITIH